MPELPEVEVVKRSLEKKIQNLTIRVWRSMMVIWDIRVNEGEISK